MKVHRAKPNERAAVALRQRWVRRADDHTMLDQRFLWQLLAESDVGRGLLDQKAKWGEVHGSSRCRCDW